MFVTSKSSSAIRLDKVVKKMCSSVICLDKEKPSFQYAWIKLMSALPIIAQPVASRFRIWSHGAWEGNILCHKITGARLVEGLVTSPTSYNVVATLRKTAPQVVASLHESKQKSSWNCLEYKIINDGQTHWATNRLLLFTYFPHQWSSRWRYRQTLAQHQTWTLVTSAEKLKIKMIFMHSRH